MVKPVYRTSKKPTFLCVWNRQVFSTYRLKLQRFPTLGLYLMFDLYKMYRIPVYSGFSLNRFHHTYM